MILYASLNLTLFNLSKDMLVFDDVKLDDSLRAEINTVPLANTIFLSTFLLNSCSISSRSYPPCFVFIVCEVRDYNPSLESVF